MWRIVPVLFLLGCSKIHTATRDEFNISRYGLMGNPEKLAEDHCAEFGRNARYIGVRGDKWYFKCVDTDRSPPANRPDADSARSP